MDLDLLRQVNRLWRKVYPYLAAQVIENYKRDSGTMLELGPFSCGISVEMARRISALDITLADESPQVLNYFSEEIKTKGLSNNIRIRRTAYDPFVFEDDEFDLVVCRGVFFFLDENGRLFMEIFRVLREGGVAFIGGGYGKGTPREVIDEIADESRKLNDRLGRKRFTIDKLEKIIDRSGLAGSCRIVEDGGLWVILEK